MPNKTKEYDETTVSACPHCFSSTHTIIDENKMVCGKCGKDKAKDFKDIIEEFDNLTIEYKLHTEPFVEPLNLDEDKEKIIKDFLIKALNQVYLKGKEEALEPKTKNVFDLFDILEEILGEDFDPDKRIKIQQLIHKGTSQAYNQAVEEERKKHQINIGQLRQYINERDATKLITNREIENFIGEDLIKKAKEAEQKRIVDVIEERLKDFEDHICRFNDRPQKCECYEKALKEIISKI